MKELRGSRRCKERICDLECRIWVGMEWRLEIWLNVNIFATYTALVRRSGSLVTNTSLKPSVWLL